MSYLEERTRNIDVLTMMIPLVLLFWFGYSTLNGKINSEQDRQVSKGGIYIVPACNSENCYLARAYIKDSKVDSTVDNEYTKYSATIDFLSIDNRKGLVRFGDDCKIIADYDDDAFCTDNKGDSWRIGWLNTDLFIGREQSIVQQ